MLMATFSAVAGAIRGATIAMISSGARRSAVSIAKILSSVGGTIGRPSVHPCP